MKRHGNINSALALGAVAAIIAVQPVSAQTTQVTNVKLRPVDSGVNLILEASSGERAQVFTTQRGNTLVADIINTQLRIPQGNSFRQDNPAPGIASVAINQLDANSVRVVVTGSNGTPGAQPVARGRDSLTLSFTPGDGTTAAAPPTAPMAPPTGITAQTAPAAGPGQPSNVAPPFLPRAVAPPVGDIAISAIDASPSVIDLGTQERVPRLVLRDAPVREVLSLLARAANMNLAYSSVDPTSKDLASTAQLQAMGPDGLKISLDIQNEPVQEVFNYVLRLSGLEANRSGRTIFVGPRLPNSARDVVVRSLRLNQAKLDDIVKFLVNLGAESAISRERQVTTVTSIDLNNRGNSSANSTSQSQSQTSTETKIEALRIDFKDSTPVLRTLQVLGDERTNSLTLIGPPKLVDIAMSQIAQLDVRRRQVAVNVKIVDVNLSGIKDFNTSFSFGVGNNFFVNDGGAASLNFGGSRPARGNELSESVTSTPVIPNPISGQTFLDPNSRVGIPDTVPGTTVIEQNGNVSQAQKPGTFQFYQPIPPTNNNPLQPGFSSITPAKDNIVTFDREGRPTVAQGTLGTATTSLPTLFQFPKRFLASLQTQVQNRNAKILTDPTLIVQEGQTADVQLTQEVVGNITERIVDTPGGSRTERTVDKERVGLTLNVKVDRIDDNGFVSLSVAPNVSAPVGIENTGNGRIILVSQRSLTSGSIRLRDGQTLILSGIIQDQERTSVSKLPILGDIPLLGSLFRRTNKESSRNEVVVLLTPQIMDDSERSSYGYNYNPSPEARQLLERRGLQIPRK
ncbi:MAG: AMIN domain-containing protein [Calothrix sp. C42_A2020_038]|nr:AMIN domain-containing protein [Calothrix sp. C42_A2020_038]